MNKNSNCNTSRIAKNTIALYIRSFITLIISLYSSRLLLEILGINDFGVYNAVGGMVMMFSFLNSSMAVASQRYLSYEMGLNNSTSVNRIFCMSINIMVVVAIVLSIFSDITGLYLINSYLDIPNERIYAAYWVLHFSVITLFISIISVPYNSYIIAKEDMKSFAYIDVIGTLLKFLAILLLQLFEEDLLIIYSAFIALIQLIQRFMYSSICNRKFKEAKYHFFWSSILFRNIVKFVTWTTLSSLTMIARNQGIIVAYNSFYGIVTSAALGIANQVNSALMIFTLNFTTSFMPQITKTYSSGEFDKCRILFNTGAKLSFMLTAIISMPLLLYTETILNLWLNNVPDYAIVFTQMIIINTMLSMLTSTSNTVVRSTGRIRNYEIINCIIVISFFVLSYMSMMIASNVYIPYLFIIIATIVGNFFVGYYSCIQIDIVFSKYIFDIQIKMLFVIIIAYFTCVALKSVINFLPINILLSIIITYLFIFTLGLNKEERMFINKTIISRINKLFYKI